MNSFGHDNHVAKIWEAYHERTTSIWNVNEKLTCCKRTETYKCSGTVKSDLNEHVNLCQTFPVSQMS